MRYLFVPGLFSVIASTLLMASCSAKPKVDTSGNLGGDQGAWGAKMQELSSSLNLLLPLVSDKKKFDDPANAAAIEKATVRLHQLSHQVRKLEKPAADPAYDSIAQMLDEDLARSVSALKSGQRDFARMTVRDSMSYCIQCHTQTAGGPKFPKLDLGFDPSKMSALAQGDYFAATRQFDAALASYLKGVKDPEYAKKDLFGWERAASMSLAISVRFNENPKEAKTIAQAVLQNSEASPSFKAAANQWSKSIDAWSREKVKTVKDSKLKNQARLDRAEKLMKDSEKRPDAEAAHSGDILFLRASANLHKWLSENPETPANRQLRAKALFLAGRAAEELRELNFWTLHERYYETCIETLPNSDMAKACYQKLSDSILLGYTGSAGLNLPQEESSKLARLKTKAFGP